MNKKRTMLYFKLEILLHLASGSQPVRCDTLLCRGIC